MIPKVFICYRRDDNGGHAGRVHDRLEREFGRDFLFMDVDNIPLGANFVKVLGEEVAKCDVVLALIGPGWVDARDENGNRRLESPYDFVRIEIETALKRDIPVIPILLKGTRLPKAHQLPDDLKELTLRNALEVQHISFLDDMERLIRGLKGAKSPQQFAPASARVELRWVACLLILLLAMPQARADSVALCDRAAADPDAAIPACTQLIEHPREGTNVAAAYHNRGVAKFGKGYLDDAIADFTSALNQNPKFVDAFKNRGLAYKTQGASDKAIDDFNQAIRLDGNSPGLYNLRGAALLDKLEFNRAIADFEKAISLNQKYRNAFVNRGLAFVFTRQLSRAIADFDMVVRLSPRDPLGYLNRAMARMDMGNFTGAIADYDEAIRLDPNKSGPYTRRGEAWRLQGDLHRSLDDHNKAIALNPVDTEAYNNRALTFKDLGKSRRSDRRL